MNSEQWACSRDRWSRGPCPALEMQRRDGYNSRQGHESPIHHPQCSNAIFDEIDRVLATHYGFTAEELDFIINSDIARCAYRMGWEAEEE